MIHQLLLKAIHVIKTYYIIGFAVILLFSSCEESKKQKLNHRDDYELANLIIEQAKEQNSDRGIEFDVNRNNEYVISILSKLNEFTINDNQIKLDSLKSSIGLILNDAKFKKGESDSLLRLIFNKIEYPYLMSQKDTSKWDMDLINKTYFENVSGLNKRKLRIGKPVYTQDSMFALVYFSKDTSLGVFIYKKVNDKWEFLRLFAPIIFQPKADEYISSN